MKSFLLAPAAIAFLGLTACEVTSESIIPPNFFNQKPAVEYSQEKLSGKVFGQDWQAQSAVLRPFGGSTTEMSLEIYADTPTDMCKPSAFSKSPVATVVIPAAYTAQEYSLAIGDGNPLNFMSSQTGKNVLSDTGKMKITAITESGFSAQLYAVATEGDGTKSEINGRIDVIDCRKQVSFAVWDELVGWYNLVELDGKSTPTMSAQIKFDSQSFYDRKATKYVRTLLMPLFMSANERMSSQFDMGPMEGLGTTKVSEANGVKSFTYNYDGPIYMSGKDITLKIEIKAQKSENDLAVQYTVEIPGYYSKTSHSFKLRK